MRVRRTLARGLAAAAVAVLGAACGSAAGPSGEARGTGTTAPRPGQSDVAPPPAASPSRTAGPAGRGPVLHSVFGDTGFTAQVVSANTSSALPGIAAPLGKTTLLVRLKVTSDPVDRTSKAPNHLILVVKYPTCGAAPDCWHTDGGARALPESDVLEGLHMNSVPDWFGTLNANTTYYKYVWQFVPEGTDLSAAQFCSQQGAGKDDVCIPLGPVEPFHGQIDPADLASS
ncbi:hypothetical protein ACFVHB_08705 [Kitasatospora sp. NPDC127111]|uniref:hypothetical protein n=1 Tax=Kitasatospora sp. NPDC127111 TaxID=3345363 RepID=UPI003632FB93